MNIRGHICDSFLVKNNMDENKDESDKRKSPRSPKKMKTECDSEKGEARDADSTAGATAGTMELSKVPEKEDQGKQGQEAGQGDECPGQVPTGKLHNLSFKTAQFTVPSCKDCRCSRTWPHL